MGLVATISDSAGPGDLIMERRITWYREGVRNRKPVNKGRQHQDQMNPKDAGSWKRTEVNLHQNHTTFSF